MPTDNMQIDLAGRVKNTHLSPSKVLWPLFEAITNSIHAIEDAGIDNGCIHIMIERDNTQLLLKGTDFAPLKNILIEDNGIGFNNDNFNSFRTSDSTFKAKRGGKGIGRLLCLKVFEHVQIDSIFQKDDVFYQRLFEFSLKKQGISDLELNKTDKTDSKTIVKLCQLKEPYQKKCPKSLEKIALRIIEHFLIYFMFNQCSIILQDNDDTIILNELYHEKINPYTEKASFLLKNETFEIITLRIYESSINESQLHLCAYQRDVWAERIDKYVPDLGTRIEDKTSGNQFILLAYLSSQYLDKSVNSERTDFNIDEEDSLFVSKSERVKMAISHIKEQMKTYLDSINEAKKQRVEDYVQKEAPRYRHVLKHRPECLQTIPLKLLEKPDSMDLELHKVSMQLELEIKKKGKRFLTIKVENIKNLSQYQAEYQKYLEQENELSKAKLAEYVAHRDIILKLLESHLKQKTDNGKYSKEKSLHSLIFPLGQTSDDIAYDDHNLWILDERLSYHKYLASDKALSRLDPINLDDDKRPDIIVFNSSLVFVEEYSRPFSSIVIIEFKRHKRQDSDDPVEQVYGYINKIRNEDVTDKEGLLISVRENTPFYCYIICSLTKKMRNLFEIKDFTKSPDEMGYFYYHTNLKAYIEVISYEKRLKDAKERNRVLFEKLNLPR